MRSPLPAILLLGIATLAAGATVPDLPVPVRALVPEARLQGGGQLRYFGLSLYDGYLWGAARDFSAARPFALDLHYRRDLSGARIAQRSLHEIEQLGYGTEDERSRWAEAMKRVFPDIRKGDRLTGVNVPGQGARFYYNGALAGAIEDRRFAEAFFAIWLDPATSQPALRRQLMGEQ